MTETPKPFWRLAGLDTWLCTLLFAPLVVIGFFAWNPVAAFFGGACLMAALSDWRDISRAYLRALPRENNNA